MPINLVDGLYQYSQPGLNALEREWYHEHVISQEGLLIRYQELAEKIAKAKDIDVLEVYGKMLTLDKANVSELMGFFGQSFVEVQLIQQEQAKHARCAPDRTAEMILRSRLKPDWIAANAEELTQEYGPLFTEKDFEQVTALPRSQWLANELRKRAFSELCPMLPSWQVRELKEFVDNELLEGADPALTVPQQINEILGKPESEGSGLDLRSQLKNKSMTEHTEPVQHTV